MDFDEGAVSFFYYTKLQAKGRPLAAPFIFQLSATTNTAVVVSRFAARGTLQANVRRRWPGPHKNRES